MGHWDLYSTLLMCTVPIFSINVVSVLTTKYIHFQHLDPKQKHLPQILFGTVFLHLVPRTVIEIIDIYFGLSKGSHVDAIFVLVGISTCTSALLLISLQRIDNFEILLNRRTMLIGLALQSLDYIGVVLAAHDYTVQFADSPHALPCIFFLIPILVFYFYIAMRWLYLNFFDAREVLLNSRYLQMKTCFMSYIISILLIPSLSNLWLRVELATQPLSSSSPFFVYCIHNIISLCAFGFLGILLMFNLLTSADFMHTPPDEVVPVVCHRLPRMRVNISAFAYFTRVDDDDDGDSVHNAIELRIVDEQEVVNVEAEAVAMYDDFQE